MTEVVPKIIDDSGRIRVTVRAALTDVTELEPRENINGETDRFEFDNQVLATTLDCADTQPIIAGSMTTTIEKDGKNANQETLVLLRAAVVEN